MTLMLASVINRDEANAVVASGVDIVDLKDPGKGALGPLDLTEVASIVSAVGKRKPVSAAAGDHFDSPSAATAAALALAARGVDYVKVGLSSEETGADRIRALGTLANWLITGDGGQPGTAFSLSMRSATSRTEVDGLDRGQTERLRVAAQALSADRPAAVAGAPAGTMRTLSPSPDAREPLRAMIDALGGLLTRVDMDETILGVHFDAAGANTVDIGKIRLGLTCAARDGHVDADLDIAVSDLDVGMVPADYAAFVPRRITIRPAVSGVRTDALLQWLRGATAEGQDRAALSAQALALLIEPGARAGIETLVIESGPLRIEGSARVRPLPDGSAGFDVHLTATGLDPMIAAVQGTPKALQILPMAFLIKGMAKPQGDSLVWDIVFADGAATINGMPFGQPPAGAPPARR